MPKNLQTTILILIIILSGAFIFYHSFWSKSPASSSLPTDKSSPPISPSLTDKERLELLNKASNIPPINPNMTYKERLELLNKPSKIPPL